MPDVLIRDVPSDDLDQIRAAAAARGTSMQGYLRDAVHDQATYLRRQAAIASVADQLQERAEVPESERDAVLAAVERAHDDRADHLNGRPAS